MIRAILTEFRKVFSIRSTYVILLIALGLEIFFAFYATGYRASAADAKNPLYLAGEVSNAVSFLSLFCAIVGVLLVTHEYRYNTIMYTLTSNGSRTRVFVSKVFVISVFAAVFAAVYGMLSPLLAKLGMQMHDITLAPQQFDTWDLLWRAVFTGWGFSMYAMIIAWIIRAQVGALAAMFLIPSMLEPLVSLLLKSNAVYLPFTALSAVFSVFSKELWYTHAAALCLLYIVIGWLVSWGLFLKRDAN